MIQSKTGLLLTSSNCSYIHWFHLFICLISVSVRLMRCKGNFSTCDICNAANDLLADHKANYSSMQRELIMKWRRLHLKQQADERSDLDRRKVHFNHFKMRFHSF